MYWFSVKFQMDGNCLDNLATLTATLKFQFRLSFVSFINKLCHVSGGGPSFKFMATFWKLWKCDNSSFIQCFYVVNMKLFDQIWPSFKFMATVWKLWRRDNASFILFFWGGQYETSWPVLTKFQIYGNCLRIMATQIFQFHSSSLFYYCFFLWIFKLFHNFLTKFQIFGNCLRIMATSVATRKCKFRS